jgi:Mrp family chromosome partitioning ATPase
MKPGEVAGVVQSIPKKPNKNYGGSYVQSQNTVIMAPEDNGQLADAKAMMAAASQHPVSQNAQPPEIELVQHSIPGDAPADPRLILLTKPDSEQAAAFRVLRHHVLDMGHPQVIAVSGPMDGCGKTTVAINLAMALAECGRAEVLLVDANLRKPKLASILRYVPPWCFAEQLHAHRTQPFSPWRFVDIQQIGLHVAAIDPRNERNQRLDAPAFAIAMERLRLGPYQHIVVDCPSVIGNADVNLIQDSTDGVLLAARTKQVTGRDIRNAVAQVTPTKILGTALFET